MNISNYKLDNCYLHELGWLCSSIKNECDKIFENTKLPEEGKNYIKVSPELHSRIYKVLMDAANIKKLIFPFVAKKKKKESTKLFVLRKRRADKLQKLFETIEISEIKNSDIRNSLEHFDEKLDEFNYSLSEENNIDFAAYNMSIAYPQILGKTIFPIRLYVASEKTFYNFKWKINLGQIYKEAIAMLNKLIELNLFPKDGPGGLMIPLSKRAEPGNAAER